MSEMRKEAIKLLANYGHVGFTFVSSIVIGFGGGVFLDYKLFVGRTSPWFTFIGLAIGIAAGYKTLLELVWTAQAEMKRQELKEDESGQED